MFTIIARVMALSAQEKKLNTFSLIFPGVFGSDTTFSVSVRGISCIATEIFGVIPVSGRPLRSTVVKFERLKSGIVGLLPAAMSQDT